MEQIRRRLNDDISIHALCEEGDDEHNGTFEEAKEFLSTPSARRATPTPPASPLMLPRFLSTPSARRATAIVFFFCNLATISIHALCEEGDPSGYYRGWFPEKFLSTPSARRATLS